LICDVKNDAKRKFRTRFAICNCKDIKVRPDQPLILTTQLLDHLIVISLTSLQFLEIERVKFALTGNTDVQRRYLLQFFDRIANHRLKGLIASLVTHIFTKKGHTEYGVLQQRSPSFCPGFRIYL